jgi:hypothetical protein
MEHKMKEFFRIHQDTSFSSSNPQDILSFILKSLSASENNIKSLQNENQTIHDENSMQYKKFKKIDQYALFWIFIMLLKISKIPFRKKSRDPCFK